MLAIYTEVGRTMGDSFSRRLRRARLNKELNQTELRDRMEKEYGVSVGASYISRLEDDKERKRPSADVLGALAGVLEVSMDYLMMRTTNPKTVTDYTPPDESHSPETKEISQLLDILPVARRQEVLALVRSMMQTAVGKEQQIMDFKTMLDSVEHDRGIDFRRDLEAILRARNIIPNW